MELLARFKFGIFNTHTSRIVFCRDKVANEDIFNALKLKKLISYKIIKETCKAIPNTCNVTTPDHDNNIIRRSYARFVF